MAGTTPPDDLPVLRQRMDEVNLRLRDVLQERARLVQRIARWKCDHDLPAVDRDREHGMLEGLLAEPGAGFPPGQLAVLLGEVFAACRALAERELP